MGILLNLDGGEHDDEALELYALADLVHIACGGHAGDKASMERVVKACMASNTRIGAHPSYVDREGFGRHAMAVAPSVLRDQVAEQCATLHSVTSMFGAGITSVKPHGALYHAVHRDRDVARACIAGIESALGDVALVGLPGGAFAEEASAMKHTYLVEAFADRGVRADGSLIPRGEPGALIDDPLLAAARARMLAADESIATLCVHADTPNSLAIVRAVRAALGPKR